MKLLRRRELIDRTGRSKSANDRDVSAGLLPPPIRWGTSAMWPEHEIDAVIAARISGQTNGEIKELVENLVRARSSSLNALDTAGSQS